MAQAVGKKNTFTLEHRPSSDNGIYWLSTRNLKRPQPTRELPTPGQCILCSRPQPQLQTVANLLAHLRTTHTPQSRHGPPRCHEIHKLQKSLAQIGYWYCACHHKYLGSKVNGPDPQGLYSFSYVRCPQCTVDTRPRQYAPLHKSQLQADEPRQSSVPVPRPIADDQPPRPAHTTGHASDQQPSPGHAPLHAQPLPRHEDIFTTHIPVLSHIPTRFRSALSDSLSVAMHDAAWACAHGHNDAEEKLSKVFLFPSVMLSNTSPSSGTTGSNVETQVQSTSDLIRERLELWNAGQFQTLWQNALQQATSRTKRTLTPQEQKQANIRRAMRLAREGAYGKAAQALGSLGVLPATKSVSDALRAKHPQSPREDEEHFEPPSAPPDISAITKDEVLRAVRSFKPGSAPGGSGLRPSHVEELLRTPTSSSQGKFLDSLTELLNVLASGKAPTALAPWIAGAPLTPLAKKDMTPRPIAVGETLRRLVSSCLATRVNEKASTYFQPLQVGIATKSGTDAVVHGVRRIVNKFGTRPEYALLSVDLKNAFNLCSRASFFNAVRNLFPQLLPWVLYCYNNDPAFLWTGFETIRSVVGTQQGDPLSGLLFALVLHPIALKIKELLSGSPDEDTGLDTLLLELWYHDDGYIVAKHEDILKVIEVLSSPEAKRRGLHLAVSKCKVWWPTAPSASVQSAYPCDMRQEYSTGTSVLNAPIGSQTFMEQYFLDHVYSLEPLLNAVMEIEDAHASFQLLRNCFGVCKVGYLLRVVPPSCTRKGAEYFDSLIERCCRTLAGGMLDNCIFKELQLPIKALQEKKPTLGIGLSSARDVAAASFLASSAATQQLCEKSLPSCVQDLTQYEDATAAFTAWSASCRPSERIPFSNFCSSNPPSQKKLTDAIHMAVQEALPLGNIRTRAFRASMSLPGAKGWVYCAPCPGLRTHIKSKDFSVWFQYFCQTPLFAPGTPCPKAGCHEMLDIYGDHLLHCRFGCERNTRHNNQVTLLGNDLARAARRPFIEPRLHYQNRTRPDIRAMGAAGGTDYFDVTFVNPLAPSHARARAFNPLTSLNAAHAEKQRKYQGFLAELPGRNRLVPVPISTLGGWHPAAFSVVKELARTVATRAMERFSKVRAILLQRHSALTVTSNAACLLAGLPSTFW